MKPYLDLMQDILDNGYQKDDRTGTGTLSVFGRQLHFDLSEGFPLLTTKKLHIRSIIYELLWFLNGDTNIQYLTDNNVHIWDSWIAPYSLDREVVEVDVKKKEYVAYTGDFKGGNGLNYKCGSVDNKLRSLWAKMMQRCYDVNAHNYKSYGQMNVSVCERWHSVKNFVEDVKLLPHWQYKLEDWNNFELDKDYYGANHYSPSTSVWLRKDENLCYTKITYPTRVITSEGKEMMFITANDAARHVGITTSSINRFINDKLPKILKGNNRKFKGYIFEKAKIPTGKVLRYKLLDKGELGPIYGRQWRSWPTQDGNSIDQISEVIAQIKENPNSRRLIVSAWNIADVDKMALPPCHLLFQFYVADGKLSCQLYQRSADTFIGLPFNIASYALLTHLVAQQCDLAVGEFVWTGGDVHLYLNHLEQARLQLTRKPYPLPQLKIKRKADSIFTYQFEDFEILDYQAHPHIKAAVAV